MTKLEKIEKLNSVLNTVKSEFIGLDSIIDEIGNSILPWYVTPEVIKRPVVISLWGMTGTGKTSVINRIIQLLKLEDKSFFYDCGIESVERNSYKSSFSEQLLELVSGEDDEITDNVTKDLIFVLDEFQHARTLDEDGCELNKSNFRDVWSLIDSGIVTISSSSSSYYDISGINSFVEDIVCFNNSHPGFKTNSCFVTGTDVDIVLKELGLFYYDRGNGLYNNNRDNPVSDYVVNDSDNFYDDGRVKPLNILTTRYARLISRILPDGLEKLRNCTTLEECVDLLVETRDKIISPKRLDCSKSLIFIIGNLDEAFKVGSNIDPDIDADIFYDKTSKVSIGDIKTSLRKRFRDEQIARFGNNIIKYPTINSEGFKKIISQEVKRICNEFENSESIIINTTDRFLDLLYSEGVFPVQGTRPVYTTIGSLFTPLLSDILIYKSEHKDITSVIIDVESSNFRVPSINILLRYNDGVDTAKNIKLTLGALRCPVDRKTRFANAVHELGHAIVITRLTGRYPDEIVAVSINKGGFCMDYDKERSTEIQRAIDIEHQVMICMAGYAAEQLFFDEKHRLLGSSSDLDKAWEILSDAVYNCGYFSFMKFFSKEITSTTQGIPLGFDTDKLDTEDRIKKLWSSYWDITVSIISNYKELIAKAALELGETGKMSGDRFKEFLKSEALEIEEIKKNLSDDYYLEVLKNI